MKNISKHIVKLAEERGEFTTSEDGFVYWWPSKNGCLAAHHLRILADELDKRNAKWAKEIEEYFDGQHNIHPKRVRTSFDI